MHVCCPFLPFSADFINLLDCFSLNQHVKKPTHGKGHILDLVLTSGLCVGNVNMADFALSDHKAVLFEVPLVSPDPLPTALTRSRPLNSHHVLQFFQKCVLPDDVPGEKTV